MSATIDAVVHSRLETARTTTDGPPSLASPSGMDRVEGAMKELCSVSGRAGRMALEHLSSGGKRLRARLALAAASEMGVAEDDAVWWAAAVELLHNATLVHDDIQDGDAMRRSQPTVWSVHGKAQAMNAGDFMLMLPYVAMSRIRSAEGCRLHGALAEHAIRTVKGQVDEMDLLPSEQLDWHTYRESVLGKTGALIALPVYGAAVLSGRTDAEASRIGAAFAQLGLMFQLQDDVLDLYGNKGRDKVGSDLYEGKVSALVVAHLKRRPADRKWLLDLLRAPRIGTRPVDVVLALHAFVESGALEDILDHIERIGQTTIDDASLGDVPGLREVASHLVALALSPIAHCRLLVRQEGSC